MTLGRATGGTDQNEVLDAIDADIDNFRSAFAHLLSTGKVNDAARGVMAFGPYWHIRRTREGMRWYQELLAHSDLDEYRRLRALAEAGRAAIHVGDVRRGERDAAEAVRLADAEGVAAPLGACEALMIEHHDRVDRETREHGDPLLVFLSANVFAGVLQLAGHTDRARDMARSAIEPGRRAGPISHCAALMTSAAMDALNGGDSGHALARAAVTEALRISRNEGLTNQALQTVFVAAALTSQRDDIEQAAVILSGVARHADPLGIGGTGTNRTCRILAQTAVAAHNGDLTVAQRRGEAMTLDDLITYTLDTLE